MKFFDQSKQKVKYQYNAVGNINFGDVKNVAETGLELRKLLNELAEATQKDILDTEVSIDVEAKLKKAITQAEKPNPSKKNILDHLMEAKALIEGITSAAGLVTGLTQAIEMVRRVF